jgi:hypothetical protein
MTPDQLSAIRDRIERDFVPRRPDAVVLLAEIERLRDALACVAAPLSPTVEDLWAGVQLARRVLNGDES